MFGMLHFYDFHCRFVAFANDATRCTWVYLMEAHDELPMIFENFQTMVIICCKNKKKNGIVSKTSYAETHEQNSQC